MFQKIETITALGVPEDLIFTVSADFLMSNSRERKYSTLYIFN
jgi:hypothetical protein